MELRISNHHKLRNLCAPEKVEFNGNVGRRWTKFRRCFFLTDTFLVNQFPENDFPREFFDVLLPTCPSVTVILEFSRKLEENNVENLIDLKVFYFMKILQFLCWLTWNFYEKQ
jgi:hypothetical protein